MALTKFFRINLPYGILRNENGEWMAFNREYLPLGFNDAYHKFENSKNFDGIPVFTNYKGLTQNKLLKIAGVEKNIIRNEQGEIIKIFLYDDGTNPVNQHKDSKLLWDQYFSKLNSLAKLERNYNNSAHNNL